MIHGFVKNLLFCKDINIDQYVFRFILILQLINSIFLPFIASIFLLNTYRKYWVDLWNYYADDH